MGNPGGITRRTTSTSTKTPLLFKSKPLCVSCLYLITSISLALLFVFFPSHKCLLFRYSLFDPIQSPLFSYPPSYGEHKHPLPTYRSTCSSPIFFSDYLMMVKEMRQLLSNSTTDVPLRYIQGQKDSFGGNISLEKRISYFDQAEQMKELPCGFFKHFPINDHGRAEIERCDGVIVVSAIFGDHDKIRQPKGLGSKTLENVCFFMFVDDVTLQGLHKHNIILRGVQPHKIGVWRLLSISTEGLYQNPAMNGVIPKYLAHRLFPNAKFSIWLDAKLQLMIDPLLLINSLLVKEDVDMAISKHPFFMHTMEEAMATTRWKKWLDVEGVKIQMETYCENGLHPWSPSKSPYQSDVPDTSLILRKHGVSTNLFSCLMFNELDAFNHRDQLAFAYVRDKMNPKIKMYMFDNEVFEQIVLEFRHNLKKNDAFAIKEVPATKATIKRAMSQNESFGLGKCKGYFHRMWGESHS